MSTTLESTELKNRVERFQSVHADIVRQVRRVIVGQEEVLEQVLIALFVGGHCLITGLPGTTKTLLVRTLADQSFEAGRHARAWGGDTDGGMRAAGGVYFVRLSAPGGRVTKTLVRVE